ncbi:MAG TPA: glycosyltransferase [Planctomycetota bacterium]|nr:glycosyltransferase [Planctomycetota bacterium]
MTSPLTSQHPSQRKIRSSVARRERLKILMTRVRLLYPLNTGGKIRTAKMIEQLSKDNDLTLVTYRYPEDTDEDVAQTAKLCKHLVTVPCKETPKYTPRFYYELGRNLFERLPYVVSKYASRELAETVAGVYKAQNPDLVMVDFLQACESIRRLKNVPFVLFQHNVEAAIFEQLAARANSFFERLYLNLQARRMRRYEKRMCRRAHTVIAVSDVDSRAFETHYGARNCEVVPTGVDTNFFLPSSSLRRLNNLVFTGSMDWLANQDAMQYFVRDIFPLIRQEIPNVMLSIVGRNPPPDIQKLGEQPGIAVTGTVDDIRPYVHGAKVYIVPLRIGSGTRLKLLEAMSMGKAIVSTTIGAEGLPVEHGKNIVLADDANAFAQEVVGLLRDTERREMLEENARTLVERSYSWEHVGRVFNDICHRAARSMQSRR